MNHLNEIAETVRAIVDDSYLYFETALEVKKTPHSLPVRIWGVCASPMDKVYVMDNEQQWHEVLPHEKNIIHSLYQRVQAISLHQLKTA